MRTLPQVLALLIATLGVSGPLKADASLECSIDNGSQVEIAECVAEAERAVDAALEIAFGFALSAAEELDDITQRDVAVPALTQSQSAWSAYRDAQCDYVGSTFGGGSGTGIAIRSCRVDLGRDRVDTLMSFAR